MSSIADVVDIKNNKLGVLLQDDSFSKLYELVRQGISSIEPVCRSYIELVKGQPANSDGYDKARKNYLLGCAETLLTSVKDRHSDTTDGEPQKIGGRGITLYNFGGGARKPDGYTMEVKTPTERIH